MRLPPVAGKGSHSAAVALPAPRPNRRSIYSATIFLNSSAILRPAQGHRLLTVDEHRRGGRLARARQADADVGVLRTRPARSPRSPSPPPKASRRPDRVLRHSGMLLSDIAFDFLRQLLEQRCSSCARSPDMPPPTARRSAVPWICRISCATSTSRVRASPGAGVSDTRIVSPMPCCSRMASACGRSDNPLGAHARLGQPEMQGVIAARRPACIDADQSPAPR